MTSTSGLRGDLTQHTERHVSRRKSRIAAYLEQRLTQLVHGPPEVQRAAQVRLELPVLSDGGEHRHHHQAAIFQLQTGPIPHSTPDVLDGGLEERRQKRIAWCRPLNVRFTNHALTDAPLGLVSCVIVTSSVTLLLGIQLTPSNGPKQDHQAPTATPPLSHDQFVAALQ